MSRFNNNTIHRFGQTNEAIKNMMAKAIPIREINGITAEEYNKLFERKPLWELSGFKNEEEWTDHFKGITNQEGIFNEDRVLNIPENFLLTDCSLTAYDTFMLHYRSRP
jgi:hypothetical protein